jgi:hypothetical protein
MPKTLILIITLVAFAGCHRPASTEERPIGTWASPLAEEILDGTRHPLTREVMEITFTPDHKELWRVPGRDVQAVARWRLEGNDLVFTTESESFFGPPALRNASKQIKITYHDKEK